MVYFSLKTVVLYKTYNVLIYRDIVELYSIQALGNGPLTNIACSNRSLYCPYEEFLGAKLVLRAERKRCSELHW